ncbi:MAG: tripartite tricarboxylate transporter substrate binding protein [Acetobacteraceae bacterium]|nr:tripartite tricarboxylate transporter substrate binding protein [Acetobacteraceae bacterium]
MGATRRAFVGAAALCTSASLGVDRALAQGTGAAAAGLHLLVPGAPGGGWDGTAQAMAKALRETGAVTGEIRVEHLPGAGGVLALPRLVTGLRGRPDTLMVGGLTLVSSPIVHQSALTLLDTAPVARLEGEPLVVAVPSGSPLRTLADFARALRADPLGLRVAGGSEGSADHILLAMVARELGVDAFGLAYLPFSGGDQAAEAVLDGRARAGISNWSEFAPRVEAGRMRALALSGDARFVGVDVPTLREGGLDVVLHNWNSVFAPPGLDEQDRARLDALVEAMARSPAWEREAARRRWRLLYLPRREFELFLRTEMRSVEATLARLGLGQPRQGN